MMLFGTMLNIFDRKWVFILAISLFELGKTLFTYSPKRTNTGFQGSLFCAVAWNVNVRISRRGRRNRD
jgi:predicted MFS family arabinose efflux permease